MNQSVSSGPIGGRVALSLVLWAAAQPAGAQGISVGVKAGVPLTGILDTAGEIGNRPYRADTTRFSVGPMLKVRLPKGLGVEFDAMYKRFDQRAGQLVVTANPGMALQIETRDYSASGTSWELPLLGQYGFGRGSVRPYVEAGVVWNRLSNAFAPFRLSLTSPASGVYLPGSLSLWRTGYAGGAGVEFKAPFGSMSAGFRIARYGEKYSWLPAATAADILVGYSWR